MFTIYRKYNNNFLGIAINRTKIEIGNIDFFKKLKYIKLDCKDDKNWIIAFNNNIEESQLQIFCDLFNDVLNNSKKISLSDLIKKYSDTFNLLSQKNDYKELIGLLTELVFIYRMQNEKLNIVKYYQHNYDQFDFKINEIVFEIKHISSEKTIIISNSQLSKLKNKDCIIGIELSFDSQGKNLYQLINEIKDLNTYQKELINERMQNIDNNLIKKTKIDVNLSNFKIIERKYLPTIDTSFNKIVIEASYKLFTLSMNKNNKEFFKKMKGIINE